MANYYRKDIDVTLGFSADTQHVQMQLKELKESLSKLTTDIGKTSPLGLTKELNNSVKTVNQLQAVLRQSTTEVGKLDLGKFRQELQKSNLDANQIAKSLFSLGDEGVAAFTKLAQSVTLAEVPIKRSNKLLKEFAVTLKNTAKWQISSSLLHGFTGALQKAYGYAQDLNKSLNNIRIVSGQTTDQMAKFAKEANDAAKSLSATTTAYTDAALIFYQQGLTGDAVKERTDAVIKMSNITGETVADVSSYMTAIWNNFSDGSETLEHFSDVITALGATTASSSAEIAQGLEKFAAIAKTVGLSYDYATSALATVVAATRQSADTVGTAFKTIFSRLQSLKLGETLDDDVNLTKYTKALDTAGVKITDLSGNLRNLDDILDDLAKKWSTLSNAQQTALAQTVAGNRQYTQLIALMNNWDSMTKNLTTAKNSEGTLQKQADIYAESWEAASKRVKAAWQTLYDQLLDDKFFIGLTNKAESILTYIGSLLDSLGGLKGILPGLTTLLLSLFGKDLANSINNAIYNLQLFSKKGKESISDLRNSFVDQFENLDSGDFNNNALIDSTKKQLNLQNTLVDKEKQLISMGKELTDIEKVNSEIILDSVNHYKDLYVEESEAVTLLAKDVDFRQTSLDLLIEQANIANQKAEKNINANYLNQTSAINKFSTIIGDDNLIKQTDDFSIKNNLQQIIKELDEAGLKTKSLNDSFKVLFNKQADDNSKLKALQDLRNEVTKLQTQAAETLNKNTFNDIEQQAVQDTIKLKQQYGALLELQTEFFEAKGSENVSSGLTKRLNDVYISLNDLGLVTNEVGHAIENFLQAKNTSEQEKALNELKQRIKELGQESNDAFNQIKTNINTTTDDGKKLGKEFEKVCEDAENLGKGLVR